MKNWSKVKLKNLCEMNSGGTPSRSRKDYYGGEICWAKISDIENADNGVIYNTEEKITKAGLNSINNRIFSKGILLLAMYGSVGKIAFTGTEMSTNQAILGIKIIDQGRLDYSFLKYWFETIKEKLLNRAVGGTLQNISLGIVNELEIPLPPLPIQKRIVEVLNAADTLRKKDQELLKKYDELAQAIFIDMFGDPIKNEKGWEVKQLKELSIKIHSGNTPKGGSNVYVDSGILFFRSQNVWRNRLDLDDIAFIDEDTHKKMSKSSLKNGDILMTKTGRFNTENSSLGRAALFNGKDDSANVNGHVYLIRLKKDQVNEYVLHILTTNEFREHIREVCVGGIDKRQLNKEHIEDFPIIYPPIILQKQFVERLKLINGLKDSALKGLNNSTNMYRDLIQRAFKEELI